MAIFIVSGLPNRQSILFRFLGQTERRTEKELTRALMLTEEKWEPSKHEASHQCCFDAGPTSATSAQHQTNIGEMTRVFWEGGDTRAQPRLPHSPCFPPCTSLPPARAAFVTIWFGFDGRRLRPIKRESLLFHCL